MTMPEIRFEGSPEDIERWKENRRLTAVEISPEALQVAVHYVREEKVKAIDSQDLEGAASWRNQEKELILALGKLGLPPPRQIR